MTWSLRALDAFPEDPGLVPSTRMAVIWNLSSKRPYANFWDL